jgi:hypothetical protein
MALVNLEDPIAFCLLPEVGLGFLAPPRRTRTLTMTTPGFALYPRRRAVTSLVGRGILFTTGSLLQLIAARLSQSRKSGVLSRHHASMCE